MPILFCILLIFCVLKPLSAQDENWNVQNLEKVADTTCNCISDLETYGRVKVELNYDLQNCINLNLSDFVNGFSKIKVTPQYIEDNYRTAIREIQIYLAENCQAYDNALYSYDFLNENSIAKDKIAVEFFMNGNEALDSGNHEIAITNYQKALELDSVFTFAWDNLGLTYKNLKKYDLAIAAYETSLKIDPNGAMPRNNLPPAYYLNGQEEKAMELYLEFIEKFPEDAEAFYGAGRIEFVEGNFDKSLQYFCQAYNLYKAQYSPFLMDAEKFIVDLHDFMEQVGSSKSFHKTLKKYNINYKDIYE